MKANILHYNIVNDIDRQINVVKVFSNGKLIFNIECFIDSPYTIGEEIQNYLDDNGYGDECYDFINITELKRGTFVSVWESGEAITTPAILDENTGEVITESVDINLDDDILEREYFEDEEGEEYNICPNCHSFILKTVIKEGVGKSLYEANVCSNSECENSESY